ncbi:hypothetical protein GE115_05960 [Agromyces sp. CFH 90414]|uniref:Uncharacterized protein n=1 Tax=Agromyces agglutinans TaxID=2662258 RepID=A0A6I2F4A6_9MICO|nr:hypothetical protein [Agromyces agglutinans]MRG59419.1 hypothetical protein [Agromyces agglutinans]
MTQQDAAAEGRAGRSLALAARDLVEEAIREEFFQKLPPMLSVAELAELTRTTTHSIRGLVQSGSLQAEFSAGRYLIPLADNWDVVRRLRPRLVGGPRIGAPEAVVPEEGRAPASRVALWVDADLARTVQRHLLRTGEDLTTVLRRGIGAEGAGWRDASRGQLPEAVDRAG